MMGQRLKVWGEMACQRSIGLRIGVLITPWLQMAVPLYSLEIACALRHAGCQVTLLFDDADLRINRNHASDDETQLLREVMSAASAHFAVEKVDQATGCPSGLNERIWRELALENAVRATGGEARASAYLQEYSDLVDAYRRHGDKVAAVVRRRLFDSVLIPGGVMGVSGVYVEVLQGLGLPYSTYDTGAGFLALAHDGVAACSDDVPETFRRVAATLTPERQAIIDRSVAKELAGLATASDEWQTQTVARNQGAEAPSDLLLLLNYRPDTGALRRQIAFPLVADWIRGVIAWSRQHSRTVCIRQHPCERHEATRGTDDYRALVTEADPQGTSARFVGASDPVNTYDLLDGARAVLPFTTRVGVEATYLGIPVITHAKTFYRGLGFTWDASSPAEYYEMLGRAMAGQLQVTPRMREDAKIAYYLLYHCSWATPRFTAVDVDFKAWAAVHPDELWSQADPSDLLAAIVGRVPFNWKRWQRAAGVVGLGP
jgi:hypothetical protein